MPPVVISRHLTLCSLWRHVLTGISLLHTSLFSGMLLHTAATTRTLSHFTTSVCLCTFTGGIISLHSFRQLHHMPHSTHLAHTHDAAFRSCHTLSFISLKLEPGRAHAPGHRTHLLHLCSHSLFASQLHLSCYTFSGGNPLSLSCIHLSMHHFLSVSTLSHSLLSWGVAHTCLLYTLPGCQFPLVECMNVFFHSHSYFALPCRCTATRQLSVACTALPLAPCDFHIPVDVTVCSGFCPLYHEENTVGTYHTARHIFTVLPTPLSISSPSPPHGADLFPTGLSLGWCLVVTATTKHVYTLTIPTLCPLMEGPPPHTHGSTSPHHHLSHLIATLLPAHTCRTHTSLGPSTAAHTHTRSL